ncbi:MAG TPA: hypothetical protein DEQ80_02295 [Anaerolinea thermolimosa]|uniref:TadE-like domain-containing protein n=1 Tax=Anaerolinea thermolimosa TaxID=229919 RepID=A0A3D1JFX8_9CHLR|nr:hypothetical protein [Anaerolinea thermolimosa]
MSSNKRRLTFPFFRARPRGQSFLELALVLPILLIMLLGLVEVAYFVGHYLDALDLTREAARFASIRDPFANVVSDLNCFTGDRFNFYWDTACVFSPPDTDGAQTECKAALASNGQDLGGGNLLWWCNGMNQYLDFNPETDDIVISLYTVKKDNSIAATHPYKGPESVIDYKGNESYYWAFSNHKTGTYVATDNWKKDCRGNVVRTEPHYTQARLEDELNLSSGEFPSDVTPAAVNANRGFVAVEIFYCHSQILGVPILTDFIPNPLMLHAYTLMPLPAAAPTATTKP